jgi:hypothetical protein
VCLLEAGGRCTDILTLPGRTGNRVVQRDGASPARLKPEAPAPQRKWLPAWRYLVGVVHPASGRTVFHLAHPPTTVSVRLFEVELAAFAHQPGASPTKQIVLVLDRAGWHTSVKLRVPDYVHLLLLPPYAPELQPAEHLSESGPLTNAALVNQHFATIEDLADAQFARCAVLQQQRERIRSITLFHWWAKQIHTRRGPRTN